MQRCVPVLTALMLALLVLTGCGESASPPVVTPVPPTAAALIATAATTRAPASIAAPVTAAAPIAVTAPVTTAGSPQPSGTTSVAPAITNPSSVVFADTIEFLGYDIAPFGRTAEGEVFSMTYYWRAIVALPADYQVFVHLTTPTGDQIVAGNDHDPAQTVAPTSRWQPGGIVRDSTRMFVPNTLPSGTYPLRVGLHVPNVMIVPVTRAPAGATEGAALGARVGTVSHTA